MTLADLMGAVAIAGLLSTPVAFHELTRNIPVSPDIERLKSIEQVRKDQASNKAQTDLLKAICGDNGGWQALSDGAYQCVTHRGKKVGVPVLLP